jgi:hypothetical protein
MPLGVHDLSGVVSDSYNGSAIYGYVWQLQNMLCYNGVTWRTEMFVHSEMTPGGGQGSVEPQRWDGDGDYYSNGCVKLSYNDILNMHHHYHFFSEVTCHGSCYWNDIIAVNW